MRFRKRPVEVEAEQWDGTDYGAIRIIEWIRRNGGDVRLVENRPRLHSTACQCDGRGIVPGLMGSTPCPEIEPTGGGPAYLTLGVLMRAYADDWIVRDAEGEFSHCKPDIFEATYEQGGLECEPVLTTPKMTTTSATATPSTTGSCSTKSMDGEPTHADAAVPRARRD